MVQWLHGVGFKLPRTAVVAAVLLALVLLEVLPVVPLDHSLAAAGCTVQKQH